MTAIDSRQLVDSLLEHLHSGGDYESFPNMTPVMSLDDIHDGIHLLTSPTETSLYLMTDIIVEERFDGMVKLSCSADEKTYELEYHPRQGLFLFKPMTRRIETGLAMIHQQLIDDRLVYRDYVHPQIIKN